MQFALITGGAGVLPVGRNMPWAQLGEEYQVNRLTL